MSDDVCPVQWAGSLAVIALPEYIDVSNAGQIREELLSVINRGARSLIADMTASGPRGPRMGTARSSLRRCYGSWSMPCRTGSRWQMAAA